MRCSTSLAMKPHIGSEVNPLSPHLPWEVKWREAYMKQFMHLEVTSPNPVDIFRLLLSNCLDWKIYCDDQSSLWSTPAVQVYELFYICFTSLHFSWEVSTHGVELTSNVWLHGLVGRASHRYRGGHGFESRWSLDFFQASSFHLLKLEKFTAVISLHFK